MVRGRKITINNRGSAFIVVLICMLLIGIIAATVLGITSGNLKNIGTGIVASDNFYTAEEALDELKDSLKQMANDAVKKAYEEYLQKYTINSLNMSEEELKREFNRIFSKNMDEILGLYFRKGTPTAAAPDNDYKELLYNYNIASITTEEEDKDVSDPTKKPAYYEIDSEGIVKVKNIKITFKDPDTGNLSTISTDLMFDVTVPSITVGSNVGLSTSVADFAVISDQTIQNTAGSDPLIMGSIYGGGMAPKSNASDPDVYSQPGLLFDGSGSDIELYSNMIITRTAIKTMNGAKLDIKHSNAKRQSGIVRDYYATIWANNILMAGNTSSEMNIMGVCYVGDDLTIDTDNSKFTLVGDKSEYYGYNTNKRLEGGLTTPAETSSSIVVNGKKVKLDLSQANMLWLAGKSYINVPENWGQVDGPGKTFQQGESVSFRSLQPAYMLPGECVTGIGHNPLSLNEYITILQYSSDAEKNGYITKAQNGTLDEADVAAIALKQPIVNIAQSFLNKKLDLAQYLDLENPCSVEFVKYAGQRLAYIYMNFRSPDKAAEYFRDYYNFYPDLVKERIKMFGTDGTEGGVLDQGGRLLVNTTGANESTHTLSPSKVLNSGNIVFFDGTNLKLYYSNIGYQDVKNRQSLLSSRFRNYYTSLDSSVSLVDQALTKNIVDMSKITENEVKAIPDEPSSDQYLFRIGEVIGYGASIGERPAFMITAVDDVEIEGSTVKLGSQTYGSGAGGITLPVRAGIIITKGNVTIKNGSDFWGTIIAQGNITFEGGAVYAASSDVKKLIQVNTIVAPYFTKDTGGKKDDEGVNTSNLVDVKYDNWKKD